MSTKKKDNTTGEMILEKKETQADIQARMETGKIEIMKVVEGIPGAEKLAELIERGKKKGKLSSSELLDVLEDMELGTDQMDKIYDTLENLGIDTVGEDYMPELADTAEPPVEEMEEITEEEIVDPNSLIDNFGTDDPVRMYLKEIGKVNLLTSEEEVELAQAMTAGNAAQEQLDELKASGEEIPEELRRELEKTIKKGEKARQRLAEANLRLVVSIAKRYVGRGMLFLDRHLVDQAGHHQGHRRPGPHHPHPRPHGGDHQQGDPGLPAAAPGAGPRPLRRGDRRGDEHARRAGAGDFENRPGARLLGDPHR